jgi:hypothetical protein
MDQLLKLAQESGMTESQGETASGGIFGLLKANLGEEEYGKIEQQFPEAEAMVQKQEKESSGGGGLMGAAMGAFGGGGGGGGSSSGGGGGMDIAGLMSMAAGAGIGPAQMQKFLPMAAPVIQQMTGVDVSSMLGGSSSSGGGSSANGGGSPNPMGQIMGMFGK